MALKSTMPADLQTAALARTYRELRGALLGFLVKQTGDAQAAEDLLHDVMLKMIAHNRNGRPPPDSVGGWLYTVARNAAIDWHRARKPSEDLPEDIEAPDHDSDPTGLELANCLRPMAERLPKHYRDAVVAAEFDNHPLKIIAESHGISLDAAKTRASRGRKLLQRELVECCRVVLSGCGQVVDYDVQAAAACAPEPGICGATTKACKR